MEHPLEVGVYAGKEDDVERCPQVIPKVPLTPELLSELLIDDIGSDG